MLLHNTKIKTVLPNNDSPPKKALVIAYKQLNADPRVNREINSLLDNDYSVDLVCVCPNDMRRRNIRNDNMNVFMIPLQRKRSSLPRYIYEYALFFLFALSVSSSLIFRNRYSFVQVFTMPEALVFCALAAKLKRIKILMDWEDPSYELFLIKFPSNSLSVVEFLLRYLEKMSVCFVDRIVTPNRTFKETFIRRGYSPEKIDIVLNAPDTRIFSSDVVRTGTIRNRFSIFFNGTILHRHGVDIGIEAIAIIKRAYPQVKLTIVGDGEPSYVRFCDERIERLGLRENVEWYPRVFIGKMPDFYNENSVVIIPNRRNPFTAINFPQRVFECGIMRKPAIISRLPGIQAYMPEDSVHYVEPDNPISLSEGIIAVCSDEKTYSSLVKRAFEICNSISWENEYMNAIVKTISSPSPSVAPQKITQGPPRTHRSHTLPGIIRRLIHRREQRPAGPGTSFGK